MPIQTDNNISSSHITSRLGVSLPKGSPLSNRSNETIPLWQGRDIVTLSQAAEEFQFYLPKKMQPEEKTASPHENEAEESTATLPEDPLSTEEEDEEKKFAVPGHTAKNGEPLNASQKREISQLKQRDKDIRAHEQAHLAAAGAYARSGATYEYKEGPDGKEYAIHGEIMIDSAKEPSPKATIAKMRVVRAAALAPASPSPQDLRVSANALRRMVDAIQELRLDRLEEAKKELKETVKEHEEVEKETQEPQVQSPVVLLDDTTIEAKQPESNTKGDEQPSLPSPDQKPQPQPKFTVNSYKKYTVNVAQYQYDSLALFV